MTIDPDAIEYSIEYLDEGRWWPLGGAQHMNEHTAQTVLTNCRKIVEEGVWDKARLVGKVRWTVMEIAPRRASD